MKILFESIAVWSIFILGSMIIFLLVQYNLLAEDIYIEEILSTKTLSKNVLSKDAKSDYLKKLERYSDVDVEVDVYKEEIVNAVAIKSELKYDAIDSTIEDKNKLSYTESNIRYSHIAQNEQLNRYQPKTYTVRKEKELEKEEIEDTISMAIDALIDE